MPQIRWFVVQEPKGIKMHATAAVISFCCRARNESDANRINRTPSAYSDCVCRECWDAALKLETEGRI